MGLTQTRASLLIVLGGCMWGVYWLPLRHLEGLGFTGASAGIALYIGCLVVLLPFTLRFGAIVPDPVARFTVQQFVNRRGL